MNKTNIHAQYLENIDEIFYKNFLAKAI